MRGVFRTVLAVALRAETRAIDLARETATASFKLRGPIVKSMLKDFDQGWMTAAKWVGPDGNELPKPSKPLD